MKKEEIDKLSIEETFEKVEEILQKISDENVNLEDSFAMYKEGIDLLGHCNSVIDKVEKEIEVLSGESMEDVEIR